ncbi:Major capsid protein precursor (GpN) [Escherichia coli]|uniref:Major capsid protein (GpN) n=1 Tax=Escherichia coli TaxID=562 RepID=A0A376ZJN9_ECOLX|nr:Major capsid protein precursor (GpN) [Escherichia coli]
MNLVMSDNARNKLGCYMTRQASINNIPVSGWYRDLPWNPRCSSVLKTPQG